MKKSQERELLKYVGDLSALRGIKAYTMSDGLADGVRAFDLKNGGGLSLTVLPDRGLDIPSMEFRGHNIGFFSKTGITHPGHYQEDGARGFLRRFYGGLLTTCGITYAGAACLDQGEALGLHGPFSNTPAESVCAETVYEGDQGDEAVLRVGGQVREACVFGANLRLHREIRLETGKNVLRVQDRVENLGFEPSPCMLVYHVNFGYPMLDEGARIYLSASKSAPRDAEAETFFGQHRVMEKPAIGKAEQCFFHTQSPHPTDAYAMLHNERLGIAAILRYDERALPLLCEWKCMRAGDYALGLEPTTAGVMGRAEARKAGLPMIAPGETQAYGFTLELTDDPHLIAKFAK